MGVGRANRPGEGTGCREANGHLGLLPHHPLPPHSLPEVPETIELEVRTSTASGLLLWQGMVSVSIQPRS